MYIYIYIHTHVYIHMYTHLFIIIVIIIIMIIISSSSNSMIIRYYNHYVPAELVEEAAGEQAADGQLALMGREILPPPPGSDF